MLRVAIWQTSEDGDEVCYNTIVCANAPDCTCNDDNTCTPCTDAVHKLLAPAYPSCTFTIGSRPQPVEPGSFRNPAKETARRAALTEEHRKHVAKQQALDKLTALEPDDLDQLIYFARAARRP